MQKTMRKKCSLEPFEAEMTASLYGLENQEVVEKHFDELYELLENSFRDEKFISRLKAMKGGARITVGVPVRPEKDFLCFVNKLWFNVQCSSSQYWEAFYVGVGVNLKRSEFSPFSFSKLWIAHAANGTIEKIREQISSMNFKDEICKLLSDHVYNSCCNQVRDLLTEN